MYPWLSAQFNHICNRYEQQNLHHALLLKGIAGIGKGKFARSFANFLLCNNKDHGKACGLCQACKLNAAESHPDLHQIESDKQVGIDAIREAIQKLVGTAQLSGAKALVIYGADTMTESAANALLKTLEEPTNNTYIILICDKIDGLLPTILSRCEKISLPTPSVSACQAWLNDNGHVNVDEKVVRLYANAPLLIKQQLESTKRLDYSEFFSGIQALKNRQISATELAVKWQDKEKLVISWVLQSTLSEIKKSPTNDCLWSIQEACIEATKTIRHTGINKSLLLTGVLAKTTQFHFTDTQG
jgi:DNA polymerase-3 subunit delta'